MRSTDRTICTRLPDCSASAQTSPASRYRSYFRSKPAWREIGHERRTLHHVLANSAEWIGARPLRCTWWRRCLKVDDFVEETGCGEAALPRGPGWALRRFSGQTRAVFNMVPQTGTAVTNSRCRVFLVPDNARQPRFRRTTQWSCLVLRSSFRRGRPIRGWFPFRLHSPNRHL